MKTIMEALLAAQQIELQSAEKTPAQKAELERLRNLVPVPILGHYDRLIIRGKRGVALVRNGVCCECHMRLPIAEVASLAIENEIHLCSSCGRYLLPAPQAPVENSPVKRPRVVRPRKKAVAATAP
jgi:predicted  nucleic acid-binding Zn-ribbon protein